MIVQNNRGECLVTGWPLGSGHGIESRATATLELVMFWSEDLGRLQVRPAEIGPVGLMVSRARLDGLMAELEASDDAASDCD